VVKYILAVVKPRVGSDKLAFNLWTLKRQKFLLLKWIWNVDFFLFTVAKPLPPPPPHFSLLSSDNIIYFRHCQKQYAGHYLGGM